MSQKARSLRKRLKEKEVQSKPDKPEITNITTSKMQQKASEEAKKKQNQMLLQSPTKRRDSYIDPLEYFQKEHIIKDENNIMDELFGEEKVEFEENGGKKEDQKTKPKPKGGMMMMGMPMPMGGMPGMGLRINFEEMMKARAKIKKEPEKKPERPASVQNRPVQKKLEEEEDNDAEPQIKAGHEQNLYIKLVLARNKFNELISGKTNIYKKIKEQIQNLRQIKDLPPKYNEKVDEYESKLKVPELLILDPDLQFIDDNKEYEKIIKNPLSLDDIITSLNINGK